jgi:hypothetical protein
MQDAGLGEAMGEGEKVCMVLFSEQQGTELCRALETYSWCVSHRRNLSGDLYSTGHRTPK